MYLNKREHLNNIAQQVIYECEYMHIPYGKIVEFTINTRAKSRWGQCCKRPDGFHININADLCDGKHDDGLRNTLFHEILHTCPKCMNHKEPWKHWAAIVYEHTGINVKRSSSAEERGFEEPVTKRLEPKYKLICKGCGRSTTYTRMCRSVKYYTNYRCNVCYSDLKLEVLR